MVRSDLPFGSEFSPSQIELAQVLEFAAAHPDDWRALEDEIRLRYFDSHSTSEYNRRKLANNCKLGMIAYGIIERSGCLTPFGEELASLRSDPHRMYDRLAQHILLNLSGLIVLQAAQDMKVRGERFSLQALRECLEERGVHFPRGGKHPSMMRLWLEKAGVVTSEDWEVDRAKLSSLVGASTDTLDELWALPVDRKPSAKGKMLALETLGVHLMSDLGFSRIAERGASSRCRSAAIDLVFECSRPQLGRWNVRCIAARVISEDEAATTVGLMVYFHTQVALLVGTGRISEKAAKYRDEVRTAGGRPLLILGDSDLGKLMSGHRSFGDLLRDQAPFFLPSSA